MSNEIPASAVSPQLPPVRSIEPESVFRWLRLGWQDLRRARVPSLLHGLIVVIISLAILSMTLLRWELVMIAGSCFLFVGPFLATGLYSLSRAIGEGQPPGLRHAFFAWHKASKCLIPFSLLLLFICTAWVIFSLLMFYLFVNVNIADPADFLRYVLTQHDGLFVLWSVLGGLFACLTFATTVISVPLLVDRDVDTWLAIRTSVRVVGENPFTMVWWAMVILALTGVSFATAMVGFLILYPLMGHASWHVYRDLVDASSLPKHPVAD